MTRWLSVIGIGEDGFSGLSPAARALVETAEILVGGDRHLAMVTLRAIENRVPLLRVANTGFSAMVDADVTIRWRTGLFESAWRVDSISWVGIRTFYARFGDVFVYGCLGLLVLVAVRGGIRRT